MRFINNHNKDKGDSPPRRLENLYIKTTPRRPLYDASLPLTTHAAQARLASAKHILRIGPRALSYLAAALLVPAFPIHLFAP